MKLTTIALFALLEASAWAQETQSYEEGYEDLFPVSPGEAIETNPYNGIKYSDSWAVANITEVLPDLTPASPSNVLFSNPAPGEVGKTTHTFKKSPGDDKGGKKVTSFQALEISVACAHKSDEDESFSLVPCKVVVEGHNSDGISKNEVVNYKGGETMDTVTFEDDWDNLRKMDFTVTSAGKEEELESGVSVVVDSFKYEVTF